LCGGDGFEHGDDVRVASNFQSKRKLQLAMFDPSIKDGVVSFKSTQRKRRVLQLELLIYTAIPIELTLGGSNEMYSVIERASNSGCLLR
jgi:hypothetical protein